jgi:hypothetical protein
VVLPIVAQVASLAQKPKIFVSDIFRMMIRV